MPLFAHARSLDAVRVRHPAALIDATVLVCPGNASGSSEQQQQWAAINEQLLVNVRASRNQFEKGLCASNCMSLLNAANVSLAGVFLGHSSTPAPAHAPIATVLP